MDRRPVRLADGDSFSLGGERYRLYGIDAPELHQSCADAKGEDWPCGTRARSELRRIIGTHPVQCRTVTTDRYGRSIAVCQAGGRDLAEEMVRAGFADGDRSGDGTSNPMRLARGGGARRQARHLGRATSKRQATGAGPIRATPIVSDPPGHRIDWLMREGAELLACRLPNWCDAAFGR